MKMKSYYDQIRDTMGNQIYHYVMGNGKKKGDEDEDPHDKPQRTHEKESESQEAETEQQEELL